MPKSVGKRISVQVGVRMPKTMKEELESRAIKDGATVTDIVIQAIRRELAV